VPDLGRLLGLVIAAGIEVQLAEQGPVLADHPDVLVGHQEADGHAGVSTPQADVTEAAEVAEGDPALLVHPVVADAVVNSCVQPLWSGPAAGVECGEGGKAVQGAARSAGLSRSAYLARLTQRDLGERHGQGASLQARRAVGRLQGLFDAHPGAEDATAVIRGDRDAR